MKIFFSVLLLAAFFLAGWFAQPRLGDHFNMSNEHAAHGAGAQTLEKQPLYWVAPMDQNYRRDKPGTSPMGMDLVPVYDDDGDRKDGGVTISPTVEHNLGVRIAEVKRGRFELPIKAVGKIAFNEDRLIHIHSRVEGWIEKTYVKSTGDAVNKGQKLFELYSPQLVNAQEEYLAALKSNNQLLKQASQTRLASLGLTSTQINTLQKRRSVSQQITHYAGQSGVVASLNVRQGMFIQPAMEILSIGPLDEVWLIAEVFERQAGWVKEGQSAVISVPALPGKTREGIVDYIYPVLDPQTRTLQVRLRFPNDDRLLKPNMFADVKLMATVGDQVLSVPREAVIRSGSHNRVVLAEGKGRYRPAFVTLGVESEDRVQILDGLQVGQQVVTSAQFLIDSESKIDVALAALEEQKKNDATPQQVVATTVVATTVVATGKLDALNPEMNSVTITHDPIEVWQWPTMKMDFKLADSVDASVLEAGQQIEFAIERTGQSDYLVTTIEVSSPVAESTDQLGVSTEKTVATQGEIKELIPEARMLSIVHEPIPEWQWPVMNMMFSVAEDQSMDGLQVGQRVSFNLTELENGDYLVDNIKPLVDN